MVAKTLIVSFLSLGFVYGSAILNTDCLGSGVRESVLSDAVGEEIKLILNHGERAFAVNIIKNIFNDFNNSGIDSNIFLSPASIYQTMVRSSLIIFY